MSCSRSSSPCSSAWSSRWPHSTVSETPTLSLNSSHASHALVVEAPADPDLVLGAGRLVGHHSSRPARSGGPRRARARAPAAAPAVRAAPRCPSSGPRSTVIAGRSSDSNSPSPASRAGIEPALDADLVAGHAGSNLMHAGVGCGHPQGVRSTRASFEPPIVPTRPVIPSTPPRARPTPPFSRLVALRRAHHRPRPAPRP